jgi:hypothetical protein
MDEFLGIVEKGKFTVLVPEAAGCCSVKLTKIEHPSIPESDVVKPSWSKAPFPSLRAGFMAPASSMRAAPS